MTWQRKIEEAQSSPGAVFACRAELGDVPDDFITEIDLRPFYARHVRNRIYDKVTVGEYFSTYSIRVDAQAPGATEPVRERRLNPRRMSGNGGSGTLAAVGTAAGLVGGLILVGKLVERIAIGGGDEKIYKLFISHSWTYHDHFEKLSEQLSSISGFEFLDHSVPKDDPLDARTDPELRGKLKKKIKGTSAVVIISGMYAAHSDWIDAEIGIAQEWGKPIIAVRPAGNSRMPTRVREAADEVVDWDAYAIVRALKKFG